MTNIAFIGLGNMGGPMAANLVKAGHTVAAFDLSREALARAGAGGCREAADIADAVKHADTVVTMLPAGEHVNAVEPRLQTRFRRRDDAQGHAPCTGRGACGESGDSVGRAGRSSLRIDGSGGQGQPRSLRRDEVDPRRTVAAGDRAGAA